MKSSKIVFRRCRPALGTYVQISIANAPVSLASEMVDHAFLSIEEVSRQMSFHDRASELSRLNSQPVGRWMEISSSLRKVLSFSLQLQSESKGQFNIAVGSPLLSLGLLPGRKEKFSWRHFQMPAIELNDTYARRLFPLKFDLGGVAKGYAVDRAVSVLQSRFAEIEGFVNAGGDLRTFGGSSQRVLIRSNDVSEPIARSVRLNNQALATSSTRYDHLDLRKRKQTKRRRTVSVIAEECMVADALTKVALLVSRKDAIKTANRYQASMRFFHEN